MKGRESGVPAPLTALEISCLFSEWRDLPRARKPRRPLPGQVECEPIATHLAAVTAPIGCVDVWAVGRRLAAPGTPRDLMRGHETEIVHQAQRLRQAIATYRNLLNRNGLADRELPADMEAARVAAENLISMRGSSRPRGRPATPDDLGMRHTLEALCVDAVHAAGWPVSVSPSGRGGPVRYVVDRLMKAVNAT